MTKHGRTKKPCASSRQSGGRSAHAIGDPGEDQRDPGRAAPSRLRSCTHRRGRQHRLSTLAFPRRFNRRDTQQRQHQQEEPAHLRVVVAERQAVGERFRRQFEPGRGLVHGSRDQGPAERGVSELRGRRPADEPHAAVQLRVAHHEMDRQRRSGAARGEREHHQRGAGDAIAHGEREHRGGGRGERDEQAEGDVVGEARTEVEHAPEQRRRIVLKAVVDVEGKWRKPGVLRRQTIPGRYDAIMARSPIFSDEAPRLGIGHPPGQHPAEREQEGGFEPPLLPHQIAVADDEPRRGGGGERPAPREPSPSHEMLAEEREQRHRDWRGDLSSG